MTPEQAADTPTKRTRTKAVQAATPEVPMPTSKHGQDGEGHKKADTHSTCALAVQALRELQAERQGFIRARNRLNNQVLAFIRVKLGWRADLPQKEQLAMLARSKAIQKEIENAEITPKNEAVASLVKGIVTQFAIARDGFIEHEKLLNKNMLAAMAHTPIMQWVLDTPGIGLPSIACVIGETGDLSLYANPGKVWKRLGLAPYEGKAYATWRGGQDGKLSKEQWVDAGYAPKRRSVAWNVGEPAFKAAGPYRELYLERKAYEHERDAEMSKGHAHARAHRYMTKRIIRDLWRAWNEK